MQKLCGMKGLDIITTSVHSRRNALFNLRSNHADRLKLCGRDTIIPSARKKFQKSKWQMRNHTCLSTCGFVRSACGAVMRRCCNGKLGYISFPTTVCYGVCFFEPILNAPTYAVMMIINLVIHRM